MRRKRKSNTIRKDTSTKARKTRKKKEAVKSRVPKPYNNGTMSNAAFWQWIRSALRRKSMYWKPIAQIRKEAQIPYEGPNKRMKYLYVCSRCKQAYPGKEVAVHHKDPCGTLSCAEDLPAFVTKMFCEKDGLELLCNTCHDKEHINNSKN